MSQAQAASNLDYRVGDQPVPGYRLVRELGRGAMGVVWLAQTDSGFDRALKVISLRQRGGKKEYRGLWTVKQRKLLHGNLLTLIDYWLKDADGTIIPDSVDLENTDSFFAPNKDQAGPLSLTQTTPQSVSTTDADPRPTWQSLPLTSRGVTMVSQATIAEATGSADVANAGQSTKPDHRPVQLIVAMELGHKTLDDRQQQCRQDQLPGIPAEELLAYLEQAARGLDYLHREGIIHRDIKPQNIMLVGDVAKVCDYGLVVTTEADLRKTSNAFTPLYASPEAVGEQPLTGRSDQYSLAITYVELRTGKSPYSSETAASVYAAKETGKYDLSRIHKSRVRNVLRKALARDPADRFTTCSEFVRQLEKAELSHPLLFWMAAAAAAVVLLAIGAAWAVPDVRARLIALASVVQNRKQDGQTSNSDDGETGLNNSRRQESTTNQLPPPPADLREIIAAARQLRLAGKFDEALAKLDKAQISATSVDPRHWSYRLERLTTELTAHLATPASATPDQWITWQQQAAELADQSPGEGAEAVQLAAVSLLADTRADSARVTLDKWSPVFSRTLAETNRWPEILGDQDQQALHSVRKALRDRLVASPDPLTTDWKDNLRLIWSDHDALAILIDRVRRQLQDQNDEGLAATAGDLEELARQSLPNTADLEPQLAAVRADAKQRREQVAVAQLRPFLREDLASAATRAKLTNLLNSLGDAATSPLARLLRIESELEAAGGRGTSEQRNRIRNLIVELDRPSNPSDRALADFGRFLRTRIDIQLYPNRPLEDAKVFDTWLASGGADWQTPARAAQAAAILLRLADAALPPEREGELAILNATSDEIAAARSYLEKAVAISPGSPAANGLNVLLAAIGAYRSDDAALWNEISASATAALAQFDDTKNAQIAGRREAITFVSALAAARLKDASAAGANAAALATFADLLSRQFHENAPAEASDESAYNLVVRPALELPIDESGAANRDRLATLWIAKARLLERDDSYNLVGADTAGQAKDRYARTMLAANQAFAKSRQLSESVTAAAGYGRTLQKLSRADFAANKKEYGAQLAALSERYDAQGTSENPTFRLASGWVSWDAAMHETNRAQQLEGVSRAIRNFRAVIAATTQHDPYALNSIALFLASNAHVRAAYWTAVGPRDFAISLDSGGDQDPLGMSKHEHLRQAVSLAQSAQLDDHRIVPEEAFLSEGNALEDLAYYCKLTDNYPAAAKAFATAAQKTGLRSKVYALLSLGRCQYRWSREPALVATSRIERVARLREAYASLKSAVDAAAADDARDAAEAHWWLGQTLAETISSGPGGLATNERNIFEAETLERIVAAMNRKDSQSPQAAAEFASRLRNFEQAWSLARHAADVAAAAAPQDEITYRLDSLDIGFELAGYLKALDPFFKSAAFTPAKTREDLLVAIRKDATNYLELSQRDAALVPRNAALHALEILAGANQHPNLTENKSNALLVLKKWEPLFSDPNDQDKLVDVLILEAKYGQGEPALTRAEQVARQLTTDTLKNRALGRILRTRADLNYDEFLKAIAVVDAARAAGRPAKPANANVLPEMASGYAQAEDYLARAKGDDVAANLAKLCKTPLTALPNGFERTFSSNLELHRLREFLVETNSFRRDAIQVTNAWLKLANVESELTKPGPPTAAARPTFQRLHDFLKPRALLRDHGLTPDDKLLLETLERKLAL